MTKAIGGIVGKRLTDRRPHGRQVDETIPF
jgi:hypothetical protein